jgi:SAM-dependent methyltransferase
LAAGQGAGRRAVDLASGSGRHALWLAAHGWQVTAVDFSRAAVERGREQGAAAGVSVDWRVADALDWAPDTPVQLVLVAFFQLPADQLRQVLRRAATWLTPDGSLLYVGHAMDNLAHGTGGPPRPEVLATVGDLAGVGEGYEIRALGHVRRPVPEHRDAIDIVLWLSPWPAADDTGP